MKKILLTFLALFAATSANAEVQIGKAAPDFSAASASGKTLKLSDYKGKIVVLEWTNPGCPFVKKFYGAGEMQKLQAAATQKGIVWLSINSSAEGHEGYVVAESANAFIAERKAKASEYLLDSAGTIGHLYGAKTTPHMFVIDKEGVLAYAGAIDDKPTPHAADIAGAHNYVSAALDALLASKKVETPTTQAYGCPVKY